MSRTVKMLSAVVGLTILVALVALVVGARTLGGGNLAKARRIAAQLQADAMAHPNPISGTASTTGDPGSTLAAPGTTGATHPGAAATSGSTGSTAASTAGGSTTSTASRTSRTTAAPAPGTTAKPTTTTKAPAANAPLVAAPAGPAPGARRQPTAGEIAQAISTVHSLLPFFTPTPDQIASAGNQVCAAFDQGQTLTQVEGEALNMVGAGSIAWMIPSSVPQTAIQTLVALYCPGYASKAQ